ncbi:hypothetical protein QBC37DRAFT_401227 [Rhypophila decipiens]|uniref:Uncharacterized protein n=1 Tax=Rhypophila decipiens TaxID=261697 RepID=A0AAN6Y7K7_9PEZI|nr:hypothetical protein QBC37DRAFT_401227 [Rhypophila decipiens]
MASLFPAVVAASTTPVPVPVAPAPRHHRRRPAGVLEYDFRRLLLHDGDMTNGCAYSLDYGIFRRNVRNLDWLTRTLAGEGIRSPTHRNKGSSQKSANRAKTPAPTHKKSIQSIQSSPPTAATKTTRAAATRHHALVSESPATPSCFRVTTSRISRMQSNLNNSSHNISSSPITRITRITPSCISRKTASSGSHNNITSHDNCNRHYSGGTHYHFSSHPEQQQQQQQQRWTVGTITLQKLGIFNIIVIIY